MYMNLTIVFQDFKKQSTGRNYLLRDVTVNTVKRLQVKENLMVQYSCCSPFLSNISSSYFFKL